MYFELKENKPHGTPENPFSLYHIQNVNHVFQIPVHWHDELEIIYVRGGSLNVNISGENYVGTPGDAFVVSPGNLHFMGSHSLDADYYTFLFRLEFMSFQTNDLLEQSVMSPLKSGKKIITPVIGQSVKDLCEQLIRIQTNRMQLCDVALNTTIPPEPVMESQYAGELSRMMDTKIVLLQFFRRMWEKEFLVENDTSGRNATEKEMISYIQQNFTEEISLKAFGAQFHLSEKYISRYFKEHFHITLSQYVNHLRLEHARQLLQDTTQSVTEVALRSGFENVSYFIRCFKKMYGVSPLQYRRR